MIDKKKSLKQGIKDFFARKNSSIVELLFSYWYQSYDSKEKDLEDFTREALRKKIFANIQLRKDNSASLKIKPNKWIYAAAASVTILFLTGIIYMLVYEVKTVEYNTAYGQVLEISLPDGSTVTLNGNSSLTYNKKWKEGDFREVWLEGEGFFNVARSTPANGLNKFTVHSGGLDIRVIGTQFNVIARNNETKVVLKEGKVQLLKPEKTEDQVIEMMPGDMAEFNNTTKQLTIQGNVDVLVHTSWTNSELIFDNSLAEIFNTLQQVYGYTIHVDDPGILEWRYRGSAPRDQPEVLLFSLEKSYDLKININGNIINIQN